MAKLKHPKRVLAEANLISSHFGPVDFSNASVLIEQFNLPPGFNRTTSRLLITLPYSYPEMPPTDLYLDKDLKKNGETPGHYFENEYGDRKIRRSGYAWISIHFSAWRPNLRSIIQGDNLLTAVNALYDAFKYNDE